MCMKTLNQPSAKLKENTRSNMMTSYSQSTQNQPAIKTIENLDIDHVSHYKNCYMDSPTSSAATLTLPAKS